MTSRRSSSSARSARSCHGFGGYLLVAITLLYGPLVLKSYRIWKIFDNPTMKNVNLGVGKLLGALLSYLLAEIVLIVVTGFTRPIRSAEFMWSAFPQYPEKVRYQCDASDSPFDIIAYVMGGWPLLFALYLAAKTRNVKGQYSETKPILAALYTLICFGGVLLVIAYLIGDTNAAIVAYLSAFGIVFISTISVCAFMGPKLWAHKYPRIVPSDSYTMSTQAHTSLGAGGSGMDDNAELEELKQEVSELRESLAEARQKTKELEANGAAAGLPPIDGAKTRVNP